MHSLLVAVVGLLVFISVGATDPIVLLDKGYITYQGMSQGSVEHFHNLKYAHDTSSSRRFAPPEPYVPPEGSHFDATTPGPACPQPKSAAPPVFAETPDISEDCLNLRIARPSGTAAGDKLPVVVHIYTGGLVRGNAEDPHWDPDNLVALSNEIDKPIIYVALNFRLSIFGYARLPILKDQQSLNVGMRDQRAGLQWVKDNIAAFGGDPDRITAFGLSAGGTMTSLQLTAYGGRRGAPIDQVWTMSGPPGTALNITSDATEVHTRAVAERLGCNHGDDNKVLDCLRGIPMSKLTDVATEYAVSNHPPMGLFTFIPSVDDDILPDRQSVLYRSGNFVKGIPMVFGWTQDDGATNAGPATLFPEEENMKTAVRGFVHALTEEDYQQLFSLYPAEDFEQDVANYEATKAESDPVVPVHWYRVSRILRDMLFTCSSIDFGFEMWKQSKALDPKFPGVRLYDLNQSMLTPLFHGMGMTYVGTPHGSDYNYLSNGVFPEGPVSGNDKTLSKSMATSFIYFAHTGNPTVPHDEEFGEWPNAFDGEGSFEKAKLSALNLKVVGGPFGAGHCALGNGGKSAQSFEQQDGSMQIPMGKDPTEFNEMRSAKLGMREKEVERERILERCAFINSLAERLDI